MDTTVVSVYNVRLFFCLLVVSSVLLAKSGKRLSCVQCTPADPRCESGTLEPRPCYDSDRYCATYHIFIGSAQGIFRGCSQRRFRGCRQKEIENQDLVICYQTCSWDGCNAGYGSKAYLL
ncbi:hypothetical protein ACOMHN_000903 [Nucella lapillus]